MLVLVLLAYDPMAVWGLVVAIVGVVISLIAAVAAIYAAYYAKKAPTAEDLAKVVENTSHLEEVRTGVLSVDTRMKRQEQADDLVSRANGVSISVKGEAEASQPLSMYLTGTEPTIHFTRVAFRSEAGNV